MRHPAIASFSPLLLTGAEGWLTQQCEADGVPVLVEGFPSSRSVPSRLWGNTAFARRVAERLHAEGVQPALVHANDHGEGLVAGKLKELLGCPGVVTLRSSAMSEHDVLKYGVSAFDAVVAVSEAIATTAQRELGTRKVTVVSDGLDEADFFPIVPVLGNPPDRLLVLGTSQPLKGWDDVFQAIHILDQRGGSGPRAFDFVGDPPDDVPVAGRRVRFLGRQPGLHGVVRRYAIVLNPSRSESFGLAGAETLAGGVPLMTTNVGILGDVLDTPELICEPSSPAALAHMIERVWRDWARIGKSGFGVEAAQERIKTRYSNTRTGIAYSEIYSQLTT